VHQNVERVAGALRVAQPDVEIIELAASTRTAALAPAATAEIYSARPPSSRIVVPVQ
jgi:hypothetical protein